VGTYGSVSGDRRARVAVRIADHGRAVLSKADRAPMLVQLEPIRMIKPRVANAAGSVCRNLARRQQPKPITARERGNGIRIVVPVPPPGLIRVAEVGEGLRVATGDDC
jgi:hypothetical protein